MESCDSSGQFVRLPEVKVFANVETEVLSITIEELLKKPKRYVSFKEAPATVGHTPFLSDITRDGVLVRRVPLDEALDNIVPINLRARMLYLSHYPRLTGHLKRSRN